MVNGQKVIKVFCHEETAKKELAEKNRAWASAAAGANGYANSMMPMMNALGYVQYVIIAILGGYMAISGFTNIGLQGSGTLTLGIDDIGVQAAQDLTGAKIDTNKVLISTSEDGGAPVAIGFRAKKANGKYRYFWLYKVKFGIPATNLTTKGESITFSTPTIEGTVLRRNKLDGQSKHPWKAEVSEDATGVAASVISGWYNEVYEPTFTNT